MEGRKRKMRILHLSMRMFLNDLESSWTERFNPRAKKNVELNSLPFFHLILMPSTRETIEMGLDRSVFEKTMPSVFEHNERYTIAKALEGKEYGLYL